MEIIIFFSYFQEKLENVLTQVHVLDNELSEEKRKSQDLKADLDACKLEKLDIQRVLELTLDEKKSLTDRINQLTVIGNCQKIALLKLESF